MKDFSRKSPPRNAVIATFSILIGIFLLAWSDVFPRTPLVMAIAATLVGACVFWGFLKAATPAPENSKTPMVHLDSSDRRSQIGLAALIVLVVVGLLNPSYTTVVLPPGEVPEAMRGYQDPREKGSSALNFTPSFLPRDGVIKALPNTVDRDRTMIWASKLFIAFFIAYTVAIWGRHRSKLIFYACWAIFVHALILSWIALHFKVEGAENVLGRFENTNPRFYGPFRYNNFWVAWLVLSLGAGTSLISYYARRGSAKGIAIVIVGLLCFIPPILTSQSRSAFLMVAIFFGISILRPIFLLPIFAKTSRKKLLGIGLGASAVAAILAVLAITSTWDRWATHENAKDQRIDRMGDTIKQFAELREGKIPDLRVALARDGLKVGAMKPVFGWGLGSFEYAHPLVAGPEFMDDENQAQTKFYGLLIRAKHVHNDWIQFWAEMGTVGFLLLIFTAWTFWKKHTRATRSTGMEGGLLTGCACVALFAFYDFPLNNFAIQCLFAACFGLAIAGRRPCKNLLSEEEKKLNPPT